MNEPSPLNWRVQRINGDKKPFALIDGNGPFGDEFVATHISEADATKLAARLGVRFLG